MDPAAFVLRDLSTAERKELPFLVDRAADAAEALLTDGLAAAQNAFHPSDPQADAGTGVPGARSDPVVLEPPPTGPAAGTRAGPGLDSWRLEHNPRGGVPGEEGEPRLPCRAYRIGHQDKEFAHRRLADENDKNSR
jgi:hypothetical protein